jgi:hypothetical protein
MLCSQEMWLNKYIHKATNKNSDYPLTHYIILFNHLGKSKIVELEKILCKFLVSILQKCFPLLFSFIGST